MKWIVEHLSDGVWSQVATFNTRNEARSAVRGARRLKAEGEYRYVAVGLTLPSKTAIKQAAAKEAHRKTVRDLWRYLPLDFKREFNQHSAWCASDCGMKWLLDELLAADVDINA